MKYISNYHMPILLRTKKGNLFIAYTYTDDLLLDAINEVICPIEDVDYWVEIKNIAPEILI